MRWFVHIDEPYYPSARVVEAETAEDAVRLAYAEAGHTGDRWDDERVAFGAVPFDQVTLFGAQREVRDMVGGYDEREFGTAVYPNAQSIPSGMVTPRPLDIPQMGSPTWAAIS